jgi:hypothetical protein
MLFVHFYIGIFDLFLVPKTFYFIFVEDLNMGLDAAAVKFVCAAKSSGVDFSETLMVGRQDFFPQPKALERVFSILNINRDVERYLNDNDFSEDFFRLVGAKDVSSIDYSSFEDATFVHDMNTPIIDDLKQRFSVVYDGGTLEHIFNVPTALKNCMEMVRVGGYFMQANMANNFMGHGFWQFSPELLFRVFSPENGFEIETVLLHEVVTDGGWYAVSDPSTVKKRVELCNSVPTYLLVIAKRVAEVEIFKTPPFQSYYAEAWDQAASAESDVIQPEPVLSNPRRKWWRSLRKAIRRLLRFKTIRRLLRFKTIRQLLPFKKVRNKEWTSSLISKRPFDQECYSQVSEDDLLRGKFTQ